MMRYLFVIFFLFYSSIYAYSDIDKKIKKTNSQLHSYSKNYSNLSGKLDKTAAAILEQKREIIKQDLYLKQLKADIADKASDYKANIKELKLLETTQKKLKEQQNKLEEALVFVIAKSVSLSVILNQEYPSSKEAIIEFEVLKAMLEKSKEKSKKLSKLFFKNAKVIGTLSQRKAALEKSIAAMDAKQKELLQKQAANRAALKKLQLAKTSYKQALKRLLERQNTLKNTLSKLNLIKIDMIKKAKEEKERQEAFKRKQIVLHEKLPKIKKKGSSYQRVQTIRYRGVKTIAPLRSYTITKKYGTYEDPIYGIKIFNESISLKSKYPNAKVRTVFNGRVIYADKTAVLKNIVVVEHKNGLHTIYANLSQIAPGIRKGKRVKRGAVIGRIKHELVFEVTQKSKHINPIRLFR